MHYHNKTDLYLLRFPVGAAPGDGLEPPGDGETGDQDARGSLEQQQ